MGITSLVLSAGGSPVRPAKWVKTLRCPESGKVCHRTWNGAEVHRRRLMTSKAWDGGDMHIYLHSCGFWHVGHESHTYGL